MIVKVIDNEAISPPIVESINMANTSFCSWNASSTMLLDILYSSEAMMLSVSKYQRSPWLIILFNVLPTQLVMLI